MSCGFDLGHYRELLDAAKAGGYRFAAFGDGPEAGDLCLRHDVDLSLDAALRMAKVEPEAGATATYFLMTESVFYNLDSKEGVTTIKRLRELGHRVGLHGVYPNASLDERFDPVVAWHNPDPDYMRAPIEGAINVMGEPYFDPATYRSDSNQHWRHGCPHEELRAGAFPWLQLLTHPEIWAYEGETMGRRCGRCSRRRRTAGSRCWPTTESTSRDGDRSPRRRPQRRRAGRRHGAPADRRAVVTRGARAAAPLRTGRFEGAPRYLGLDEQGREVLSYIEGEPASRPRARGRRGRRRARIAATPTPRRADRVRSRRRRHQWQTMVGASDRGDVVCHHDLFWPNVDLPVRQADCTDRLGSRGSGPPSARSRVGRELLGAAAARRAVRGLGASHRPPPRAPPRCSATATGCPRRRPGSLDAVERRRRSGSRPTTAGAATSAPGLGGALGSRPGPLPRRQARLVRRASGEVGTWLQLKPITVLVTASGAPGTAALLRGLRENGEREVRLVGTDMSERSIGRHLCDAFHLVPAGGDPGFADAIRAIVEREHADCVLPQSSFDLEGLAAHRDAFPVPVLVSRPDTIHRSNDKAETYALLHRLGSPRRLSAASTARARSRPRRASSATRTGPSASSRSSRRARAASACSTRPSTARTSSSTSGPARWRCGSRRPSTCCPPRAARTCS